MNYMVNLVLILSWGIRTILPKFEEISIFLGNPDHRHLAAGRLRLIKSITIFGTPKS